MMLYGLLNLSLWGYVIVTAIMVQITFICISLYLHRSQAHRALDLHPALCHFFRFWLWLTTGMGTKEWVAIHRKHHAKCETADDPHSPQVLGIRKVLLEGAELYRKEAKNQETLTRYGEGTPNDWLERNLYSPYSRLGIALMFIIELVLFGIPAITIWAIQMLATPIFAAGIVNGIGHFWGYRNFECDDAARNIIPWGLFICGEELHNNHHTYAISAKFSVKPWEFDMGWFYIKVLQKLKLAHPKRVAPKLAKVPGKTHLDIETLKAVVTNRFQIMAQYSREVLMPVLHEEQHKASEAGRALLKRAKNLLVRADSLLDDMGKQRISHVLEKHQSLQLVYQYRLKLQAIWGRTTANQRELLEALQQWCKEAEASGINTLRRFAEHLAGYCTAK